MAETLQLSWNYHSVAFRKFLNDIHLKESYSDGTIMCEDKIYPIHSFVLSTCSDYFKQIFDHCSKLHTKHPFIAVNNIGSLQLEALLNYMYKGEVNISKEMVPSLFKSAELLKIKGLGTDKDDSGAPKVSTLHNDNLLEISNVNSMSDQEAIKKSLTQIDDRKSNLNSPGISSKKISMKITDPIEVELSMPNFEEVIIKTEETETNDIITDNMHSSGEPAHTSSHQEIYSVVRFISKMVNKYAAVLASTIDEKTMTCEYPNLERYSSMNPKYKELNSKNLKYAVEILKTNMNIETANIFAEQYKEKEENNPSSSHLATNSEENLHHINKKRKLDAGSSLDDDDDDDDDENSSFVELSSHSNTSTGPSSETLRHPPVEPLICDLGDIEDPDLANLGDQIFSKAMYDILIDIQNSVRRLEGKFDQGIDTPYTEEFWRPLSHLPELPLKTIDDFDRVENYLDNETNRELFCKLMQSFGGTSTAEFTTNIMKGIMSNRLATLFNWCGRKNPNNCNAPMKRAFKDSKLWLSMRGFFTSSPLGALQNCNLKQVEDRIKQWLVQSAHRSGGKIEQSN